MIKALLALRCASARIISAREAAWRTAVRHCHSLKHSLLTAVSRLQFLLIGFCLIALPITHHGRWAWAFLRADTKFMCDETSFEDA